MATIDNLNRIEDKIDSLRDIMGELVSLFVPKDVEEPLPEPLDYGLPELKNARLEFYDNGPNCKRPITQYGLVLDVNMSKHRFNLNFEKVSHHAYADQKDRVDPASQDVITRVINRFVSLPVSSNQKLLMCGGQINLTPGNGYKLVSALTVGAVLLQDSDDDIGWVWLFYGDKEIEIKPGDWRQPGNRAYKGLIML